MLYRLVPTAKGLGSLEPLPFLDSAHLQSTEKDLENLLATHLLEVLFEDAPLLPIFQERQLQSEADVYALNRNGDLVIFELKRGMAGEDAAIQAIGYAQHAGRWVYSELDRRYRAYLQKRGFSEQELRKAHQQAFLFDTALEPTAFNQRQHIYVVGNAANEDLIAAIDYWKRQGLSIEFLPYRIYDVSGTRYFEFFSFPYDRHRNPSSIKGVLFDTNRSYDENSVWEMMEQSRVAAYGDVRHVVEYLSPRDIVLFYHTGMGLIAAAEVLPGTVRAAGDEELYRDVRFLTPVPERQTGITRAMSSSEIVRVTGQNFFWARTLKVPYLDRQMASNLVTELNKILVGGPGPVTG